MKTRSVLPQELNRGKTLALSQISHIIPLLSKHDFAYIFEVNLIFSIPSLYLSNFHISQLELYKWMCNLVFENLWKSCEKTPSKGNFYQKILEKFRFFAHFDDNFQNLVDYHRERYWVSTWPASNLGEKASRKSFTFKLLTVYCILYILHCL